MCCSFLCHFAFSYLYMDDGLWMKSCVCLFAFSYVMAVCSFNMHFTWIWSGWEGLAYDWRISTEVTTRPNTSFPHPQQGKQWNFNLVYKLLQTIYCCNQLLTLWISTTWLTMAVRRGYLALYSSFPNIIERLFDILKASFPILTRMPHSLCRLKSLSLLF